MSEASLALLILSSDIEDWKAQIPGLGAKSERLWPKYWTRHWDQEGHYLCTCGAEEEVNL